jgi:hypothetical protein
MGDNDYSGTPLWKKLGLKEGARLCLLSSPDGFRLVTPSGVTSATRPAGLFDVILLFTTTDAKLKKEFASAKRALTPAGGLWIAYPKKSSAISTNLTFETVQRVGLDAGLVDNKSCAIDGDWSGVRFVYRLKDR